MKFTNTVDLTGNWLINLKDAVNPQDAVTYAQLQAAVQGYSWKQARPCCNYCKHHVVWHADD